MAVWVEIKGRSENRPRDEDGAVHEKKDCVVLTWILSQLMRRYFGLVLGLFQLVNINQFHEIVNINMFTYLI